MATLKEWETHFETLPRKRLQELLNALEALQSDDMFDKNYHRDLYDLKYSIKGILSTKPARYPNFCANLRDFVGDTGMHCDFRSQYPDCGECPHYEDIRTVAQMSLSEMKRLGNRVTERYFLSLIVRRLIRCVDAR